MITGDDPWCGSHGSSQGSEDLGAGLIYYSMAYANKARTCVCLGSGGGFVPRLMRQAQRDLALEGSRTILVDGHKHVVDEEKKIWGTPCWAEEGSALRKTYPEIEIILDLTYRAYEEFFVPGGISIDFLHIDADHHYDGVRTDWDLYSPLVTDQGIITLHDTVNYREPCGVPTLLQEIREQGNYEIVNFPIRYGTAILRKHIDRRP